MSTVGPVAREVPASRGVAFFNPKDPDFNRDPYPHYKRLREEDPVHWSYMGIWFLSRYDDVRAALKDPRLRAADIPARLQRKNEILRTRKVSDHQPLNLDALIANSRNWFAFMDPPEHTRLRRLVQKAFTQRTVEDMRPYIRARAQRLIERVRAQGHMDVMKDFAAILAMNVIATMFGMPEEDFPRLASWTERLSRIFDPLMSLEEYATLDRASSQFMDYLRGLIRERRREPRADLLSALIAARDEHAQLTEDELVSICILVFGAGEESTINLIGNGTLALLRHPEQMEHLRRHPEILPTAVEEFLRYDPPLQMTSRRAAEDIVMGDKLIHQGELVYFLLGSANRDPAQFERPDTLDLEREHNRHVAFSEGHHFCLGAPLARVEGQEGFRVLLEMLPDMRLAVDEAELRWRDHNVIRGLMHLPIVFRAA